MDKNIWALVKMAPTNLDNDCVNVSSWYQTFLTRVNGNGTHVTTNVQFYNPEDEIKDDKHAVLYIVVVLLFYSVGIIIAIIHYLKREKEEIEEEKAYENYVQFRSDPYKWSRYYRMQQVLDRLQILDEEKEKRKVPIHVHHSKWHWLHKKKSQDSLQKQTSRESASCVRYIPVASRSCDFPAPHRLVRTRSLEEMTKPSHAKRRSLDSIFQMSCSGATVASPGLLHPLSYVSKDVVVRPSTLKGIGKQNSKSTEELPVLREHSPNPEETISPTSPIWNASSGASSPNCKITSV